MIISEFSSIDEKFTTMLGTCLTYNGLKQKKLSNLNVMPQSPAQLTSAYVNALISTNQSGICENLSLESAKYLTRTVSKLKICSTNPALVDLVNSDPLSQRNYNASSRCTSSQSQNKDFNNYYYSIRVICKRELVFNCSQINDISEYKRLRLKYETQNMKTN
ncbi:Hypothetical_protein [Hexamita inflata]|uniref:Hypothetical_protein n=1 Tax=Hexamita inflata TaxID=28002 RepID=A0AA86NT62_9EUKA|nr:Hypothetical protein HINF_LOCUS13213 [Hexamita inflata]CAI9966712.1 Hypothetical protein HINF_LOCUS54357 [Hexamita inflata]